MWGDGGNPRGLLPKKKREMATLRRLFLNITGYSTTWTIADIEHKQTEQKKLINAYILFHLKARHSSFQFRTKHNSEDHLVVRLDCVFRLIC